MRHWLIYICTCALLAACGLKGPLYFPDEAPDPRTTTREQQRQTQQDADKNRDNKPMSPTLSD